MKRVEELQLSNSFARLPEIFYQRLPVTPLRGAHLVAFNSEAARLIDLHPGEAKREDFHAFFNGEKELPGSEPLATIYAGHQFGQLVPQLGDGRAILLGEVTNEAGERWELQLKGAGITPFSRRGDGRAVLRSTIREYLCSEAMYGLGIPTTRALVMTGSREEVYRKQIETGAMLLRMAPSHVRFGSFELFYYRREIEPIRQLADYVIAHHYPELVNHETKYLELFRQVTLRSAEMISQWQQVGFAHGVMNTDNMSILGLTLDYGPFGFIDRYEPGYICNHTDQYGRYAFDQQPAIGGWNLSKLGQALLPILEGEASEAASAANAILGEYEPHLQQHYHRGMLKKLGLTKEREGDKVLIDELLKLLDINRIDYTLFFRALCDFDESKKQSLLRDEFLDRNGFDSWAKRYAERLQAEESQRKQRQAEMKQVNPKYILRNYLAQQAIEMAEAGDYSEIERLHQLLQRPFDEQPENEHYAAAPPEWSSELEISCSS
ncbi:MAG: protein adenylyltransferase SelO [Pseudomonadota bacterium]